MSGKPGLLLASVIPVALRTALAERFILLLDPAHAPNTIRAIVGGGMSEVSAELIARLPALEIVSIHGVGHDGVDLDAARARGIRVTLTPDVLTDDVADLAIGLLLAVQRRIAASDRAARAGEWTVPLAHRASGRRIGIYGMGAIGQAIARRAAPFARELLYTSRTEKPDLPARFVADVATLAQECDVLIVAVAGGAETAQTVNAEVIAALGPNGVLVNIARGSVVDEPALIAALQSGALSGAGLDVFADEPGIPAALQSMEQVVLSQHRGSATVEGRAEMAALVLANLDAHFAGEKLPSAIV